MAKHLAYIGVGTNIAPRSARMREAFDALEAKWQVLAKSSIYLTKPVGFTDQPEFLNAVVAIICEENPKELFKDLKLLESSLGRVTRERWHEREIDFDILFFDSFDIVFRVLHSKILECYRSDQFVSIKDNRSERCCHSDCLLSFSSL